MRFLCTVILYTSIHFGRKTIYYWKTFITQRVKQHVVGACWSIKVSLAYFCMKPSFSRQYFVYIFVDSRKNEAEDIIMIRAAAGMNMRRPSLASIASNASAEVSAVIIVHPNHDETKGAKAISKVIFCCVISLIGHVTRQN